LTQASSIFHATNITVGYRTDRRETILFNDITLNMAPGQLVCLMGPNGAGKSTLIRSLASLQPLLGGMLSHRHEKHVAVVLTDRVNSPHMTVEELISFGRYPYVDWKVSLSEKDLAVIKEVIARVHIEYLATRKLYELSDGQLQMAMIARALAQDTPVLMLDEPTAHLDLNNRLEIMNLLRQLTRESGKAILVSTHELDLALQTADVVWLAAQEKITQGIPEDLVLNGSFDEVFKFKGFDLKSGRVQHSVFRSMSIQLEGTGPEYLWTKNALERSGFNVGPGGTTTVRVRDLKWQVENESFSTLQEVLKVLSQ